MPQFFKKDIRSLEQPHKKAQLSTTVGRAIERASYTDIVLLSVVALCLSSTYFVIGIPGHTLSKNGAHHDAEFLEALYFCVVTFTSLGYGDLSPIGFGRLVASVLVFWGLGTIALVIGKIASERSQTSLLLLHRSDVERRLSAFAEKFASARGRAETAAHVDDREELLDAMRALEDGHQAANRYLIFHANQSTALVYGNDGVLSTLAKEFAKVQEFCVSLHKKANEVEDTELSRSSRALAYRLYWTANFLRKVYQEAPARSSFSHTITAYLRGKPLEDRRFSKAANRVLARMENCLDRLEKWRSMNIIVDTLQDVLELTPGGPMASWPRYLHKDIARKVGSSNNRISKHLDHLIKLGRLPK